MSANDTFGHRIKTTFSTKLSTLIISALTVVAGLAWNNAITAIIDHYYPESKNTKANFLYKLSYAVILTIAIIIFIIIINELSRLVK